MPELPEVETVVRSIRRGIVGCRIAGVNVSRKKLRQPWSKSWSVQIIGKTIRGLRRRGKWIIIELDAGSLLAHLGMTGQLKVVSADVTLEPHTHLVFDFGSGLQLRFRDERRFGSVRYFAVRAALATFLDERLGPEPFAIDAEYLRTILASTKRSIKAVLLDQSVIAGVGNIYADESLFLARIHPANLAHRMTAKQATALSQAIEDVLTNAIELRGSSIRNYLDGTGQPGQFQKEFQVYGRLNKPCPRCRTLIRRIRLAGRSTHFCPKCQKSPVVRRQKL
jgi:formamidopyrimidine-DNA glycosylase